MEWRLLLAGLAAVAFVGSAAAQTAVKRPRDLEQPPVWRSLERFSSDAELMRYIRDVQRLTGVMRRRAEARNLRRWPSRLRRRLRRPQRLRMGR